MSAIYKLSEDYERGGIEISESYFFDFEETGSTYCVTFGDSPKKLNDKNYTILYDVTEKEMEYLRAISHQV